jgi:hypothetical protein
LAMLFGCARQTLRNFQVAVPGERIAISSVVLKLRCAIVPRQRRSQNSN